MSQEAIEHLVFGNCSLMDRYLPGLLAVAIGNVRPAQAIADVQRGPDAQSAEENSGATGCDCPATPPEAPAEIPVKETSSRLEGFSPRNN